MEASDITGVILAAGKGTRMRQLGMGCPKPLLQICNKPLIYRQIEQLKALGITNVFVVIGHLGHQIVTYLSANPVPGVNITFKEQEQMLGIAHAIGHLEECMDSPFLLLLGDIVFHSNQLSMMLQPFFKGEAGAVLAVKEESDVDAIRKNFSIVTDEAGFAKRVMEKPRIVTNNLKGCGLYLFDLTIFDAVRKTPRTAARDEYEITDSIQILIDLGVKVKVSPVIIWDINLTYTCDLLTCNLYWKQLHSPNETNLIGSQCRIHQDAKLHNVVIGDGVKIIHPIQISDSLILSGSTILTDEDLQQVVVTPNHITQCKVDHIAHKG